MFVAFSEKDAKAGERLEGPLDYQGPADILNV